MKQELFNKSCPRIGVFTAWFSGHYQSELILGIEQAARSRNVQIIYFPGRSLHSPHPYENGHNLVYDTALYASLDGLIILSLLANYCNNTELTEFIARYKHIPIITINFRSSYGNALLTDNTPGFNALMKHLIKAHNYRKLAFLKGPECNRDTIERFKIYKSALSAEGIAFNPALITAGHYTYLSGKEAVKLYLDKQGLKPGRDIEVIVCANDTMAFGVIDELHDRGLHVPGDIAVTGFDNINESIFPKFPLTSVRQQLHEIGNKAVYNLLEYVPHQEPLIFDTELVIRLSCGCQQSEKKASPVPGQGEEAKSAGHADSERYKTDLEFIFNESISIMDNLMILKKKTEFTTWMQKHFSNLGIESAWLFLDSKVPSDIHTYTLLAGYDMRAPEGEGREEEMEDKITEKTIFDNILYRKPNRSFCLFPLLFKEEKYGLFVIEVHRLAFLIYDTLSNHVGSSIKNILLGAEVGAMNQQLIQSNNLLREANEQKTQFFINVAHETKTPLTLIQNYLARYLEQQTPDENLLVIKQNIDLLLTNMLNFLDVEKLQKGNIIYQHNAHVDLSESAYKKCTLFRTVAEKKNIRIILHAENNIIIRIDPWALDRIFNNLLDNAVKYTQAGGRIFLDVWNKEGKAMLRISDNGPGLPVDTYSHIFEPYYLLSKKKTGWQGIGVGLSIVKKIIEGLGAAITVEKRKGGGTTFTIAFIECSALQGHGTLQEIPATAPSLLVMNSIKERNISTDKHSLLIVDDNTQMMRFLQTALEEPYNVFLARDVPEALFKLRSIPRPDLIVSDIMMDGPDGFQLLTALSETDGYNDIPFIFLTALGGEKEKIRGLSLGAVDYIEKPFSITALTVKIDSLIALRRRQEKQEISHIRSRIEEVFSDFDKDITDSAKPGFNSLCGKYRIIGREQDIIRLLLDGLVYKEIASHLNISLRTVEYHITKIFKKCGVRNKYDLLSKIKG